MFFVELGIPFTQDKTRGPATTTEFLGINLDTVKFQALLPKKIRILVASTLLDCPNCSKHEPLSWLGLCRTLQLSPAPLCGQSDTHAVAPETIAVSREARAKLAVCPHCGIRFPYSKMAGLTFASTSKTPTIISSILLCLSSSNNPCNREMDSAGFNTSDNQS